MPMRTEDESNLRNVFRYLREEHKRRRERKIKWAHAALEFFIWTAAAVAMYFALRFPV